MIRLDGAVGTASRDHTPDGENDDRADDRADESGPLARPIPADRLAEIGRHDRPNDPEDRRQDEATRFVASWHNELGDHARQKADDDGPDDARGPSSLCLDRERNAQPRPSVACAAEVTATLANPH